MTLRHAVAFVQGVYFFITGFWPVINRPTFEAITGRKSDFWLVRTIGTQISTVGVVLGWAGLRRSHAPELPLLGVGTAAGLAASDLIYTTRGRISPVYLLDFLAEIGLIGLWVIALALPSQRR